MTYETAAKLAALAAEAKGASIGGVAGRTISLGTSRGDTAASASRVVASHTLDTSRAIGVPRIAAHCWVITLRAATAASD